MWLSAPQMANGVDEKCRIEHGKCASHAGKEETADSTHDAVIEKTNEKRAGQTRKK